MDNSLLNISSGGGVTGWYQDINEDGEGRHSIVERWNILGLSDEDIEGKSLLDVGCNQGGFLKLFLEKGGSLAVGIDIREEFVSFAQDSVPQAKVIQGDFTNISLERIREVAGIDKFDYVLAFAVWDYFSIASEQFNSTGDMYHAADLFKNLTKKYLFFEGHDDGIMRIKNDIVVGNKVYRNWTYVLKCILGVEFELLGLFDKGRRPIFKCWYENNYEIWKGMQEEEVKFWQVWTSTNDHLERIVENRERHYYRFFDFNLLKDKNILEIGGGPFPVSVKHNCSKIIVLDTLVDEYKNMENNWLGGCELNNIPAEDIVLEYINKFDAIIFLDALDHCYNPTLSLSNAIEYIKQGGLLYLWSDLRMERDFDDYHRVEVTEETIDSVFRIHNMTNIKKVVEPGKQYPLLTYKAIFKK